MKTNRKRQMSLGVVLSYLSIIVKLATGILYTPIVLNTLGQSQYGVYSLCISFVGYLTVFNAGINAAYIRFYVQTKVINEADLDRLNGVFCKIFIVLSVLSLLGGLSIAYFSPALFGSKLTTEEYDLIRICFVLLAFTLAIEVFTCLFKSFITANEAFIFGKSLDVISAVLNPVLTLPFLLYGYDCTAIISVRLGVAFLTLLLNMTFCRKILYIRFLFAAVDRTLLCNIGQFSGFIALQSIMDQMNWQVDKFILAWTNGTSDISIYSVGSLFNSYFILIGSAVSGVFIAEINRLVASHDDDQLNSLFRRTSKWFTYLICFIILVFFIFGRAFILRWAGMDYDQAFTVGWLLMAPVTLALIMGLGQDIARAKNKHQIQIVINVCVCVINVLMSIPLAVYYGAIGSAIGTFVAEIIVCIIIQPLYYKKVLGLNINSIFTDWVRFLPGLILPVAFGITINYFGLLHVDYISIALYGAAFAIIYIGSVMLFSMNYEERQYIISLVKNKVSIDG